MGPPLAWISLCKDSSNRLVFMELVEHKDLLLDYRLTLCITSSWHDITIDQSVTSLVKCHDCHRHGDYAMMPYIIYV